MAHDDLFDPAGTAPVTDGPSAEAAWLTPDGSGRRIASVWLPGLATDRLLRPRRALARRRRQHWQVPALAVVADDRGRQRVRAVTGPARSAGVLPGMVLADARAILPTLEVAPAAPDRDREVLADLADWAQRYTPWAAVDGADGLLLDVTGCAGLFGGEAALLTDLRRRLAGMGFAATAALADTVGAAWAIARALSPGRDGQRCLAGGEEGAALAPLPVERLRLTPEAAAGLHRVGLHRIGDLAGLSRTGLTARFGPAVCRALDRALGREGEAISPRRPPPDYAERLAFADPIGSTDAVRRAVLRALERLDRRLELEGLGARRLTVRAVRSDGTVAVEEIGTSRPRRGASAMIRLFDRWLDRLDVGFGLDAVIVEVPVVEPLAPEQGDLDRRHTAPASVEADVLDRLAGRLGPVRRIDPVDSHWPERAARPVPAYAKPSGAAWPTDRVRPTRLLVPPEPVEATAPLPDAPPVQFRWRGRLVRVARADGPERLLPEWWPGPGDRARPGDAPVPQPRDYYRVEDEGGGRWWLYRAGLYRPVPEGEVTDRPTTGEPAWYLHGLMA